MKHYAEMKARGLYPCCYDIRTSEWFVIDGPYSAVIPHMPLIAEQGSYWHQWPVDQWVRE